MSRDQSPQKHQQQADPGRSEFLRSVFLSFCTFSSLRNIFLQLVHRVHPLHMTPGRRGRRRREGPERHYPQVRSLSQEGDGVQIMLHSLLLQQKYIVNISTFLILVPDGSSPEATPEAFLRRKLFSFDLESVTRASSSGSLTFNSYNNLFNELNLKVRNVYVV